MHSDLAGKQNSKSAKQRKNITSIKAIQSQFCSRMFLIPHFLELKFERLCVNSR